MRPGGRLGFNHCEGKGRRLRLHVIVSEEIRMSSMPGLEEVLASHPHSVLTRLLRGIQTERNWIAQVQGLRSFSFRWGTRRGVIICGAEWGGLISTDKNHAEEAPPGPPRKVTTSLVDLTPPFSMQGNAIRCRWTDYCITAAGTRCPSLSSLHDGTLEGTTRSHPLSLQSWRLN